MSKSACKCKKPAECEECPEWIFTFADLVMLMMGFFVILWVLKPPAGKQGQSESETVQAENQWLATVGEIRKGFGYEPNPQSSDRVDQAMIQKARGSKEGAENEQKRESNVGTDHNVTDIRPGSHSVVGGRLLFDAGSAKLTPETMKSLDQIGEKILGHYAIVVVKGHAALDDLPDGSTPAQQMDLSLRRAQGAADYLMSKGVSAEVLRIQGCSTFEPIRQRAYTSTSQSDNRRVEIEWTSELVEERKDQSAIPTAPLNDKPVSPGSPVPQNSPANEK